MLESHNISLGHLLFVLCPGKINKTPNYSAIYGYPKKGLFSHNIEKFRLICIYISGQTLIDTE